MRIALDTFPVSIRPHAKRKDHFHGNGTPEHPTVGGWVVDSRAVSYDAEAHTWLKANGFYHYGRRWLRPDDAIAN